VEAKITYRNLTMEYSKARKLSANRFKRLTGVQKRTFKQMVELVKNEEKKKKKVGCPCKLRVEDQVLMTLQYLREYRTQYHIGTDWGVSESTVCRTTQKIENILIRSGVFSLPGKKELRQKETEEKVVAMDVTESPIEKPKENQKNYYSGKQKEHTLKTQIIVDLKSKKIICLASGKGRVHDFKLFQNSGVRVGDLIKMIADKGYQGIAKIHKLSETPIKRKKGKKLSKEEKQYNRLLNRLRVVVEHVNRRLKIFRILSSTYRNRHRRFGLRANLIAGIYNYELETKVEMKPE
jgi:IS5 family transposase